MMAAARAKRGSHAVKTLTLANGDTAEIITTMQADASGNLLGESPFQYSGATGGIINATDTAIAAAAGAGVRNYLTALQFKNTSAVASEIVVKDGATIIWRGHVSASMTVMDGWTFTPPLKGSANTAMNVTLITTGTATIVSAQGYTGA